MGVKLITLEDKLTAIEGMIVELRDHRFRHGSKKQVQYEVLKAVAGDLRARMHLPRSNALGDLDRAISQMVKSKDGQHYDANQMAHVANTLVGKWGTVRQALEQFGEESSE